MFVRCCAFVLLSVLGCSSVRAGVLVLAPHPDDDIIIASGVINRAVGLDEATVVFMTNGDHGGKSVGLLRQGEAVDAQVGFLGTTEDNLIFLGYPDTGLQDIFNNHTSPTSRYETYFGQSVTYGTRGLGRMDYHSYRFGAPAAYNLPNLVTDMASILSTYRPDHIYTPSEFDQHTDHATTYRVLRLALDQVHAADPSYSPVIHKTVVLSTNYGAWPAQVDPSAYLTPIPGLSTTPLRWEERASLDVPLSMQDMNLLVNLKYRAVQAHTSQAGPASFIGRFVHKDEVFWSEAPFGSNQPPVAEAGSDKFGQAGQMVFLDGSLSRDPEGSPLSYQWLQRTGSLVSLVGGDTVYPSFLVPAGATANDTWGFQLTVSDGTHSSAADMVTVFGGTPAQNLALTADASASSQNSSLGSRARFAKDRIVEGAPTDPAFEWVSQGQGAGAWIRLSWSRPVEVASVRLHDRPNLNDWITGGTLSFSDGTSVAVGALDNDARTGTTVNFAPRLVRSLTFTVNSVNPTTTNVGLAEVLVFGPSAGQGDTTPPTAPTNLAVSGATSSSISLSWGASTDSGGSGLAGYRVYRDGAATPLASVAGTAFTDSALAAGSTHSYRVTAYDAAGNESAGAGPVSGTTQAASDTTPPTVPTSLILSGVTPSSISLSWGASTDSGGSGLAGYRVYRDGATTPLASVAGTAFTDSALAASTTHSYRVTAYDVAGNESAGAGPVSGTTQAAADTTPPTVPANLAVSRVTSSSISLSWSASTDNGGSGLAGYRVYRDGATTPLASVAGTAFTDSALAASTTHSYRVTAYDVAGNESAGAGPVSGTTQAAPDTTPPSAPLNLAITGATTTTMSLGWGASTDAGGSGLAGYRVYRDGAEVGAVSSVDAVTMAFDGYGTGSILTSATVDGYLFTSEHFHIFGDAFELASNGTDFLAYESSRGYPITMSRVDGQPFSLLALDGGEAAQSDPVARPPAEAIGIRGTRADGTTVVVEVALDGINDGVGGADDFQHFILPSNLTNLTSVLFYGIRADGRDGGIVLDNLVIGTSASTGAAVFTDTGLQPGTTHSYHVTAFDGAGNESAPSNSASGTTDLQANVAPVLTNPGAQSGTVGVAIAPLQLVATDGNNDALTFDATGLPAGLSMSAAGLITGTPSAAGTSSVTVTVDDGHGGTDSETFSWVIAAPANVAPVLTNPGAQSGTVGVAIAPLQLVATDGNNDALTFDATGLPAGLSMSAAGLITGTPSAAGTSSVTVTVDDGHGGTDSETFSWVIAAPANVAPVLTNPGAQSGTVGVAIAPLQLVATDGNNDALTFDATGLPAGLSMSAAGLITGTPSAAGTSSVTVTVDDGHGGTDSETFSWVIAAPANVAPVLTNPGAQSGTVGVAIAPLQLVATDGNNDALTFDATGLPAGLSMSAAGLITGTPSAAGTSSVTVTVDDGHGGTDSETFSWVIAAPANVAPVLTNPGAQSGTVGVAIAPLQLVATDGNNDALTFDATGLPAGLSMSAAGLITGTPSAAGTSSVTVTVDDGHGGTDSETFSWVIAAPANVAPVLTNPGAQSGTVGVAIAPLQLVATDGNNDALTFDATGLPAGLSMSAAGLITGTPSAAGTSSVTVTVDDGHGGTDSETFSWVIAAPANVAPVLTNPGAQSGTVGVAIAPLQLVATDGNNDALTFDATGLPAGLSMSAAGLITGTPSAAGTSSVTVTVDDGHGGTDSETFSWVIAAPNVVRNRTLVLAPHPDDDIIIASGVINRTVGFDEVTVVFLTNGDHGGKSVGLLRQGEAVDAQVGFLGTTEDNLIFLGYPDTGLQDIFNNHTSPTSRYETYFGQSVTYGTRGLGRMDYHSYRFGAPAAYNLPNLVTDMASILSTYRPDHIYTPSEFDQHTDHATTYRVLRLALDQVHAADPSYSPVIHKTVVLSTNYGAWPAQVDPSAYLTPIPGLSTTPLRWEERASLDVPLSMQDMNLLVNLKYRAVQAHTSQAGPASFIGRFVHKDEVFWSEAPFGSNQPPVAEAGSDKFGQAGQMVFLDGSLSRDPEGSPLSYQWLQRTGSLVSLVGGDTVYPSFLVPAGATANDTWGFQLTVSDGTHSSAADMVTVFGGTPAQNLALTADASASSQNSSLGSRARFAKDRIVEGAPTDPAFEWVSQGQGAGAWIRLSWSRPVEVASVRLHDRPNLNDWITGGTLSFSDGTSVAVGALDNDARTGTTVNFAPRLVRSLTFTVNSVNPTTTNVGLAEVLVFGPGAGQ